MRRPVKKARLAIRLDVTLIEEIKEHADRLGEDMSTAIRLLLRRALNLENQGKTR